jgi:hypothetical protein
MLKPCIRKHSFLRCTTRFDLIRNNAFKKSKMLPLKEQLKGTLIVPIVLVAVLIPFSMLIGWNLLTAILFWFLIVPAINPDAR